VLPGINIWWIIKQSYVYAKEKIQIQVFVFNGNPEFRHFLFVFFTVGGRPVMVFKQHKANSNRLCVYVNSYTDCIFWVWEKCLKGLCYKIGLNKCCIQSCNNTWNNTWCCFTRLAWRVHAPLIFFFFRAYCL